MGTPLCVLATKEGKPDTRSLKGWLPRPEGKRLLTSIQFEAAGSGQLQLEVDGEVQATFRVESDSKSNSFWYPLMNVHKAESVRLSCTQGKVALFGVNPIWV